MGWITEAAGLGHGVCPECGFEEINLSLIHKNHRKSFLLCFSVCTSISAAGTHTLPPPKTLVYTLHSSAVRTQWQPHYLLPSKFLSRKGASHDLKRVITEICWKSDLIFSPIFPQTICIIWPQLYEMRLKSTLDLFLSHLRLYCVLPGSLLCGRV